MSRLGMADLGVATLNDMRDNAGMIASLDRSIPVIADADTGYGGTCFCILYDKAPPHKSQILHRETNRSPPPTGPLQVGRTVTQYISAGVTALHLEDQVLTKRCGHLSHKQLVPEETYLARIRAAVNARRQSPGDIVIIARTDALASLGFEPALTRLRKALAIGADVAFLEGLTSASEAENACRELAPAPVLLNMAHGGLTPSFDVEDAKKMGFRIVIFPSLALNQVYTSVSKAFEKLRREGKVSYERERERGGDPSLRELFAVCGLEEAVRFDADAGGEMFSEGV